MPSGPSGLGRRLQFIRGKLNTPDKTLGLSNGEKLGSAVRQSGTEGLLAAGSDYSWQPAWP